MSEPDPRVRRAEGVLREFGLEGRVEARGPAGEIASLTLGSADPSLLADERGARLAERIRALGFRFVALDLAPPGEGR